MVKTYNILMVGVGGQGVVLASDILGLAAMYSDYDIKKSEIHGMSQRGGSIFSFVRFGEKVYSPLISEKSADLLVSFEEMETLRWLEYVNPETVLFVSKTRILPSEVKEYPAGIEDELKKNFKKLKMIDAADLIKTLGNLKFLNVCILGLIASHLPIKQESWAQAIKESVPEKFYEKNMEAFELGKKFDKEGLL